MLMQLPDEWLNQEFLGDAEKPFLYPTDQIFEDDEKIDTCGLALVIATVPAERDLEHRFGR